MGRAAVVCVSLVLVLWPYATRPMAPTLQRAIAASLVPSGVQVLWAQQQQVHPDRLPKGHFCTPMPTTANGHACRCQRIAHDYPTCEGTEMSKDQACAAYCSEHQCLCPPVKCEAKPAPPPSGCE